MAGERAQESFTTLTHARLRAAQGDVNGALRILGAILETEPDNRDAARLASELAGARSLPEPHEEVVPPKPPVPGRPQDLGARFRDALGGPARPTKDEIVERLSAYLVKVVARRGARRNG